MSSQHETAAGAEAPLSKAGAGRDTDARHLPFIRAVLLEQGITLGDGDALVLASSYGQLRASADRLEDVDFGELR